MKLKNNNAVLVIYILLLIGLSVYSFSLTDPNLTLVSSPLWESFRDVMVQFGYLNRHDSWLTYLALVTGLFGLHLWFMYREPKITPLNLACIIGGILLLSYPLLSHDFFNYIFDAKIFTVYGKNPYTHTPIEFTQDPWLRFMQWTHRRYPYGPTFLPISIIVSYLSFGKFILNYLLFKGLFVASYIGSVWILQRLDKKMALFFATSPLILLEGVVNAHNDMLAVFFGLLGVGILAQAISWPKVWARLTLLVSGGIKYFTVPTLILQKPVKKGRQHRFTEYAFWGVLALIVYVSATGALQPWYFLNLAVFIPYYFKHFQRWHILMYGLIVSYYPIIRYGKWEPDPGVNLKNIIVYVFLGINIAYVIWLRRRNIRPSTSPSHSS